MPNLTLPDGSVRNFDASITGLQLANDIGPGLAKAALIVLVDGFECDLDHEITQDSNVSLITRSDELALKLIRHDCAHVMAAAVQELFPETQVTIGPSIENGFYYDFFRKTPFAQDDLETIEKRMHELVDRDDKVKREVWNRERAIEHY